MTPEEQMRADFYEEFVGKNGNLKKEADWWINLIAKKNARLLNILESKPYFGCKQDGQYVGHFRRDEVLELLSNPPIR